MGAFIILNAIYNVDFICLLFLFSQESKKLVCSDIPTSTDRFCDPLIFVEWADILRLLVSESL